MINFKVTILLATCNRAHLIRETLDSIINQTYTNWECIITDDNSTDITPEVVGEFLVRDKRFSYFKKPEKYNRGLSGTRNFGMDLARERGASLIQFFDDDDIMYPSKLELQVAPFEKNPHLNFTVCKYDKLVENNGNIVKEKPELELRHSHIGDAILTGDFKINSLSGLWNFHLLDQFRFDERLSYAEEWELFIRIGYNFPGNYDIVDEYLYAYRKHPETLTLGKDENYERRKTSQIIRLIIVNYLTDERLHSKTSIIFFSRTFLTFQYNPEIVKKLLEYVKSTKRFSSRLEYFLIFGLKLSRLHYRILGKISTWV